MEPISIRVILALSTYRIISLLLHTILIKVGIDIYIEVNLVDIKLVQQLGLKPYWNKDLPILRAIN